jgi:pimeloyl-ACP methyl ester carboxylesterase
LRRLSLIVSIVLVMALCCFPSAARSQAAAAGIEGNWQGTISAQGFDLRIVVQFTKKGAGAYSGSLESVDQGAQVFPIDTATLKSNAVHFEVNTLHASWDGKLNDTGTELTGKWTQGGKSIDLNMKHGGTIAVLKRPQEPHRPYPYQDEEVLYDNKSAGTKIGGTLTLPRTKGPFAAVLLITGSGQQNRDEELLGHRPFLIIADYLTRRGIAVLRVDDRGMGKSTGDFAKATTADFATDVEAGIAFLKVRHDIRKDRIGLIGHSEGGVIAPMVAARSKDVAFIVMLAGSGVDGGKIILAQSEMIAKAQGASDELVKFNRDLQEHVFAVLAAEKDPVKAKPKVEMAIDAAIEKLPVEQRAEEGKQARLSAQAFLSPWMRYFVTYDPAPALEKVTCPVLVMNGEKDLQVPPKLNLPAIEAALKAGGNKDYTIKLMPGMNHLFQSCTTGSPSEYSTIEETMAPLALKTMGDWIFAHTR